MTAQDHIVAWIESSAPHYARLLKLAIEPKEHGLYRATTAANLATSAYHQMAYFSTDADKDYTAQEILGAAIDLLNWEKPENDMERQLRINMTVTPEFTNLPINPERYNK